MENTEFEKYTLKFNINDITHFREVSHLDRCGLNQQIRTKPCLLITNLFIFNQVSSSVWVNVADRSKSINLELLEEMFQIEEKEKVVNPGKLMSLSNISNATFHFNFEKKR